MKNKNIFDIFIVYWVDKVKKHLSACGWFHWTFLLGLFMFIQMTAFIKQWISRYQRLEMWGVEDILVRGTKLQLHLRNKAQEIILYVTVVVIVVGNSMSVKIFLSWVYVFIASFLKYSRTFLDGIVSSLIMTWGLSINYESLALACFSFFQLVFYNLY